MHAGAMSGRAEPLWREGGLTAKAVMVLSVLGLICAGMKARMKFGTLHE